MQRVETLAVLLIRGQMLAGKQSDVDDKDLPNSWDDIFAAPEQEPESTMSFDEIDDRMGWGRQQRAVPVDLLTPEEIDERMGW